MMNRQLSKIRVWSGSMFWIWGLMWHSMSYRNIVRIGILSDAYLAENHTYAD